MAASLIERKVEGFRVLDLVCSYRSFEWKNCIKIHVFGGIMDHNFTTVWLVQRSFFFDVRRKDT